MTSMISYRQKLRMLPVAVLAAMLLIYFIAISRTIQLNRYCKSYAGQNLSSAELTLEYESLNSKILQLNRLTGQKGSENATDPLLNFISITLKSSGKLVEYLPVHEFRTQNHLISTRITIIESDYKNLLIFLNDLEKNYMDGKVVSVRFESDINVRTGRKRLLMTLYIQSITDDKSSEKN